MSELTSTKWQYERQNLIQIKSRADCQLGKAAFKACYECEYTAQIGRGILYEDDAEKWYRIPYTKKEPRDKVDA